MQKIRQKKLQVFFSVFLSLQNTIFCLYLNLTFFKRALTFIKRALNKEWQESYQQFCEGVMDRVDKKRVIWKKGATLSTKQKLSGVTSSTCMKVRKCFQVTIMGKPSWAFLGNQHAGMPLWSVCTLIHAIQEISNTEIREERADAWLWSFGDHRDMVGWSVWLQCCNERIDDLYKGQAGMLRKCMREELECMGLHLGMGNEPENLGEIQTLSEHTDAFLGK